MAEPDCRSEIKRILHEFDRNALRFRSLLSVGVDRHARQGEAGEKRTTGQDDHDEEHSNKERASCLMARAAATRNCLALASIEARDCGLFPMARGLVPAWSGRINHARRLLILGARDACRILRLQHVRSWHRNRVVA